MAVTGVIGGVDVQDDLLGRVILVELNVLSEQESVQLGYLPGGDAVFEAGQCRLAS